MREIMLEKCAKKWRAGAPLVPALFFIFLFLQAINIAHAAEVLDISDFAYGLPANIEIEQNPLNFTPTKIRASIRVSNYDENDIIIYLLKKEEGGQWAAQKVLGLVQPGGSERYVVYFEASYAGKSRSSTQYAVVATGGAVPLGKYFEVEEDWSEYESEQKKMLFEGAQLIIPALAGAIIFLLLVLSEWAYRSKAGPKYKKEYTVKTFFLPVIKGKNIGQVVAGVLINPLFWALEVLLLMLIAAIIAKSLEGENVTIMALTFLGALFMPVVYFSLIWIYNELVERMPMRFLAGAFVWGISAAVASLIINSYQAQALAEVLGLGSAGAILVTTAVIAPVIEEVLKGLGLLGLSAHHEYSDTLHGLHLGLATGLGFAFVENWLYFASKTDPLQMGVGAWAGIIIYRSFFNSIAHACFSGVLGATLGWAKEHHSWGKLSAIIFIPGVATAVVLHSIFNITAIMDGFEALSGTFPVYRYNPTMIITLLSIMVVLLIGATIERRHGRRGVKKYTSYKEFKNK